MSDPCVYVVFCAPIVGRAPQSSHGTCFESGKKRPNVLQVLSSSRPGSLASMSLKNLSQVTYQGYVPIIWYFSCGTRISSTFWLQPPREKLPTMKALKVWNPILEEPQNL